MRRQTLDLLGTEVFKMAPLFNQEVSTSKFRASALENVTLANNSDTTMCCTKTGWEELHAYVYEHECAQSAFR